VRTRLAVAVGLAGLAAAGGAHAGTGASRRAPARLLVQGTEYHLQLSRGKVMRGPAVIQFVNRGQDPHDLRLRRIGAAASRTISVPETRPGGLVQFDARLRRGRYRLWCSLPGHDQRGMHAVLVVRRGR
jgi:hypothetical protein